jgi:hypothetical protein
MVIQWQVSERPKRSSKKEEDRVVWDRLNHSQASAVWEQLARASTSTIEGSKLLAFTNQPVSEAEITSKMVMQHYE